MSDPLQLSRISLKKKAIQTFTIPPIPKMPDWVVRQFKLEPWQNEMEIWRQNTQSSIRTALKAIQEEL